MPEYVLSVSYGKNSLACLGAIKHLGLPLDRIVHAEVWATDTIPADLPPMVEFKKHADKIIKQHYGIEVEHVRADNNYEKQFYKLRLQKESQLYCIYGFPCVRGAWCNSKLKTVALDKCKGVDTVSYIGIACDEPDRFHSLNSKLTSPLVEAQWSEADCYRWCQDNDLLSPIYTDSARGGCWFCHNQPVGQLRLLRRNYPDLWALLLKWDIDSPVSFKPDGHTVHDFDRRFQLEDDGFILPDDPKFRWAWLEGDLQMKLF